VRTLCRYRPRRYQGRINLLVNEESYSRESILGWSQLAREGLIIHKLPGDHLTYIRDHAQTAAKKLRECLEASSPRPQCSLR
ncbi:MAG TPA: hypothetical protein VMO00_14905, partial [Methylomirabilota bacterium]|nr:hypothetical protein [Methylomirabilota bacterium]